MRIAMTGASGLVGSALAEHLEAAGHEVYRVRRGGSDDRLADWDPALGWVRPGALDGVDAVVSLAGAGIAGGRWSPERRAVLRSSRIEATRLLVDHLRGLSHPPRVFVAASAIGYYGDGGDEPLSEDAPVGEGFLAALVRDWEEASLGAEQAGMRAVVLRTGHVLSARGGMLGRLLPLFRLGLGSRFGSGRQYMSWIAIDDLVRIVESALTADWQGVYNATAPEPVTNAAFAKALGRALHRPVLFTAPTFALRVMLGRDAAEELLLWGQRVLPTRLQAAGFEFRHAGIDEAFRAILASR